MAMKSLIKRFWSNKKASNSKASSAKEAELRSPTAADSDNHEVDANKNEDPQPDSATSLATSNDDGSITSSSGTAAAAAAVAVAVPHQMSAGDVEDVVQFAKYFWGLMNKHETDAAMGLCTDDCNVMFINEDLEIPMRDYFCEAANLFVSFTNMRFDTGGYRAADAATAIVPWFQAKGKHVGEPYGFGPFPPIAAKGISVCNDPEELVMKVVHAPPNHPSGCKLLLSFMSCRCIVKNSERTGPAGLYRQIGGFPG